MPHPLNGLYILRYGKDVPGANHTASVLDQPKDIAIGGTPDLNEDYVNQVREKLQKFSPLNRNKMNVDQDFARSYIVMRQQTEDPLRMGAKFAGIMPENFHPIYFVLHHDINPDPPLMPGKVVIAIPAENIPEHLISFTVDDSFCSFPNSSSKLPDIDHGKVFNSQTMGKLIGKRGWLSSTEEKPRYYEAQLWSRRIVDFNPLVPPSKVTANNKIGIIAQAQQQAPLGLGDASLNGRESPTDPRLASNRRSQAPAFKPA